MRIVIDLQGAQSSGSRNRGIGRYSTAIAKAIIRNRGEHDVHVAVSALFPQTIEPIREEFADLLTPGNFHVWTALAPVCHLAKENDWRRKCSELIRETFLASLQPDVVYVTSLFEGLSDDALTSVGSMPRRFVTAVTLYDLIPLINRSPYLDNPVIEAWYQNKLHQLRRADLLLSISASSRQEGIDWLGFPPDEVVSIGTAADPQFHKTRISTETADAVRSAYGLRGPFVMYTGGIDHRKNIEGLIRAFALLPTPLRQSLQLAVVCAAAPHDRDRLQALAQTHGLQPDELVVTGFVPEDHLVVMYHLCKLFVFPSWHEGFGLPALEAMACGAPVIAAGTSSLPEVIGRDDALFDPRDDQSIADKMLHALTDDAFRESLIEHAPVQAAQFSWDKSARIAIAAFERLHAQRAEEAAAHPRPLRRPRLAYVSPLPPLRTGIADYSIELLPELSRHYDIDVILNQDATTDVWTLENCAVKSIDEFKKDARSYDRVLYHVGNSEFHSHQFELLREIPGVVVLHDFYLSGVTAFRAHLKWQEGIAGTWERELYESHGLSSVADFASDRDLQRIVYDYPCNLSIVEHAKSVIVHGENSLRLADHWLGSETKKNWAVIPHLRVPVWPIDKPKARAELGIESSSFVVCSFGILAPTKQNLKVVQAWCKSRLGRSGAGRLIFVGQCDDAEYRRAIDSIAASGGCAGQVSVTGWTDVKDFRRYLSAADLGVQLRTLSRGETSGTVLDCMNFGLPTIVNANGSMRDLPNDAVWKLDDEFTENELIGALDTLWQDEQERASLSRRAREAILVRHSPRHCANMYEEAIEHAYAAASCNVDGLCEKIAALIGEPSAADWMSTSRAIAKNHPSNRQARVMLDVSSLLLNGNLQTTEGDSSSISSLVSALARKHASRIEVIYVPPGEERYRYATKLAFGLLGCAANAVSDDLVEWIEGDSLVCTRQGATHAPNRACAAIPVKIEVKSVSDLLQFITETRVQ